MVVAVSNQVESTRIPLPAMAPTNRYKTVILGQKKQVPFKPGGGPPDNPNARAALM